METTRTKLLERLPEIDLPQDGDQPGRYTSYSYRVKKCRWHRRGVQKIMNFSPSSSFNSQDSFIGDAKFNKTTSVSVEVSLLNGRGRRLRKVHETEQAKDTLKSKKARKEARYLLVISDQGKKDYAPSHTSLSHDYEVDVYPL